MATLTKDELLIVRDILLPLIGNESDREGLVQLAFFDVAPLVAQIDVSRAPDDFAVHLLIKSDAFGVLPSGQTAVDALLEWLHTQVGVEKQQQINKIRSSVAARISTRRPGSKSTSGSLLRSVLPFSDGDRLIGRTAEIQDLLTLVQNPDARLVIVWGPPGTGKTSLLRAGIVPALRAGNAIPIYLQRPTENLIGALSATFASQCATLPNDLPFRPPELEEAVLRALQGRSRVVFILDQFEEFFRTSGKDTPISFARWLGECIANPRLRAVFLLAIREDFFARLHHLSPYVLEPTRPSACFELEELTRASGREVLEASREVDGTDFKDALIEHLLDDLESGDHVRPAELQIVGSILKRRRITTAAEYAAAGGAKARLRGYIQDEISRSVDPVAARVIARALCAPDFRTKASQDIDEDELTRLVAEARIGGDASKIAQATIARFVDARIAVITEEHRYNLAHDYLAPLIATATAGFETPAARANRLANHYVAGYEVDSKTRIPIQDMMAILRHGDRRMILGPRGRPLVMRTLFGVAGATAGVVVLVVGTLLGTAYAVAWRAQYLSTAAATREALMPSIVLRSGHPALKWLPGFNQVVVDTGYSVSEVQEAPEAQDAFPRELLVSFRGLGSEGYRSWADEMLSRMDPASRARGYRLLGSTARARNIVLDSLKRNPLVVNDGLDAVGLADGEVVSREFVAPLEQVAVSAASDANTAKWLALASLGALFQGTSKEGPSTNWYDRSFEDFIVAARKSMSSPKEEKDRPSNTLGQIGRALNSLAISTPQAIRADYVEQLLALRRDKKFDPFAQWEVLDLLRVIAKSRPDLAPAVQRGLLAVAADELKTQRADGSGWLTSDTLKTISSIVASSPTPVTSKELEPLLQSQTAAATPIEKGKLNTAFSQITALNDHLPSSVRASLRQAGVDCLKTKAEGCAAAVLVFTDPQLVDESARRAASILWSFVKSEPEAMFQADKWFAIEALLRSRFATLGNGGDESCGPLIKVAAEVVTEDAARFADDPIYELSYRAFGCVSSAHVETLTRLVEKSIVNEQDYRAAKLLGFFARFKPADVLSRKTRLFKAGRRGSLGTSPEDLQSEVSGAVATATYSLMRVEKPTEVIQTMMSWAHLAQNSDVRTNGIYGLFLMGLDEPTRRADLRKSIYPLLHDKEPHVRMAARKVLEMLALADLAVGPDDAGRSLNIARLQYWERSTEAHIRFAASQALRLILWPRVEQSHDW
jgi:hypothetical protein